MPWDLVAHYHLLGETSKQKCSPHSTGRRADIAISISLKVNKLVTRHPIRLEVLNLLTKVRLEAANIDHFVTETKDWLFVALLNNIGRPVENI